MHLHIQGRGQDLITELSLPKSFILDHMSVSISIRKINIKIFYWLRNLLLNASFIFLYFYYIFVGCPIPFDILESLLKKEGQILGFSPRNSQALNINMTVILRKLLKKDNLHIIFVKGLN